jgi:hypothetical protein
MDLEKKIEFDDNKESIFQNELCSDSRNESLMYIYC